jgi:clan AA aspartic protease (TIGR02281 family)
MGISTHAALCAIRTPKGRRSQIRLGLEVAAVTSMLLFTTTAPLPASGNTYRCADAVGTSIFTDSPSQLENCTAVKNAGPSAPSIAPAAVAPEADRQLDPLPRSENGHDAGNSSSQPDAQGQLGQVTVPVHRAGRSLTVQAKLNGTHNARLIVDTGADITILSHKVAMDLGIVFTSSSPTVTLNTVGGSVRADVVRLGTIAVGTAEVSNVPVAVHTLPDAPPEVDGLLGLTFLDKFLVTLDAQKGELHLRKRE